MPTPAWKSTYDRHKTREAAAKDAARRRKGSPNTTFAVKAFRNSDGPYWVVYYKEKA